MSGRPVASTPPRYSKCLVSYLTYRVEEAFRYSQEAAIDSTWFLNPPIRGKKGEQLGNALEASTDKGSSDEEQR